MQMSTFPLWDLSLVVEALTRAPFEPLAQVSFKLLSLKTAFLLAKVGDLQALSIKEPFFLLFEDRVLRQDPLYLPKVALCGHRRLSFLPFMSTLRTRRKDLSSY